MNRPIIPRRPLARRLAAGAGAGASSIVLVVLLAAFGVVTPFASSPPASAAHLSGVVDVLQYNVQFLNPIGGDLFPGHWPNTTTRAQEIGRRISCFDIVALNETVNEDRRREILDSAESSGRNCEKPARHPDGRQFALVDGPDLAPGVIKLPTPDEISDLFGSNATPIIDDEVAILTRLPVIATHMQVYKVGSGIDSFAAKGIVHARLWSGGDQPAGTAIDVFATHLDQDAKAHDSQVAQLGDFVRAHSAPDRPTLIMGDFNIDGNPAAQQDPNSEYSRTMATLRSKVNPNLRDTGTALGGTNEARDQRIDFILTANNSLTGGDTFVEDFPHPSAAAPHTTLSDHAGVDLWHTVWAPADPPPVPAAADGKRVTAQVNRLQSLTSDACNDFTDYFGRGSIGDGRTTTDASFGLREGNDIGPDWSVTKDVAGGVDRVGISLQVDDDDDVVCGGGDDEIDVTDVGGTRFNATADFATGNVTLTGSDGNPARVLGRIGQPIFISGTSGDRARMTVVIDAQKLGAQSAPVPLPLDRDKLVRVGVDRLRATSSDSCNGRMDFFGTLELRAAPTVTRRFGVVEGNDINPGWAVEGVVPAGTRTVDAILSIRDDDDALCGGGDDDVDVNPATGSDNRAVRVRIDLATQQVTLMDPTFTNPLLQTGFAGQPLRLQGSNGDETGIIDFSITIQPR
jgi:endonuclease/exonuclease/phosphatase family metal-dependent hydrolase